VNVIKEHMNSPAAKAKVENSSREVSESHESSVSTCISIKNYFQC